MSEFQGYVIIAVLFFILAKVSSLAGTGSLTDDVSAVVFSTAGLIFSLAAGFKSLK